MIRATVVAAMACAAFGQSAGTPPHFEVASIKPAAPPPDGRFMIRERIGPGRLDYTSVSLKAMIQRACGVQDFQVSGPDWMASARFDVVAKLPAGTPSSKVPEMLRSLLAERFKVATHRETRELPTYALVVGKNGPKMKESEVEPDTPSPDAGPRNGGLAANGGPEVNRRADAAGGAVRMSQEGTEQFAPGLDCGPRGETEVRAGWMMNKGPGHMQGHSMNMASVTNMLAALLGRPVVDQTGLKGNYDFDLAYTPEGQPMTLAGVPPPQPPGAGAPVGGEGRVPSASDPDVNGVSLFTAVQSQLGLKLDTKKGPVEVIVVDHVEKTPTEN
jgi:uncharacterized protein (TIGR03435 family)